MLFRQRKDNTLLFIAEEGLEKPGQKCIFFNKMIIYCLFSLPFQSVSVDFRQSSTSSHNVTKGRRSLLCFLVCGLQMDKEDHKTDDVLHEAAQTLCLGKFSVNK
jgi:hypothetical protein